MKVRRIHTGYGDLAEIICICPDPDCQCPERTRLNQDIEETKQTLVDHRNRLAWLQGWIRTSLNRIAVEQARINAGCTFGNQIKKL